MRSDIPCWYFAIFFILTGCGNVLSNKSVFTTTNAMAVPLQPTYQQGFFLVGLGSALENSKLSTNERCQLLFQRAILFDSLGLYASAANDYAAILELQPGIPEVYTYLGLYYAQEGDFDDAYEFFDSAIELSPIVSYAHFNRGIALYYGNRYKLSLQDLLPFYQKEQKDPYRALWIYIVDRERDEKSAKLALQVRYNRILPMDREKEWGWNIIEFYLGKISEETLLKRLTSSARNNVELAEHLSETLFYLGKYYLSRGDEDTAIALFKLAVANNVYYFIEHRYALLELTLLNQFQSELSEANTQ